MTNPNNAIGTNGAFGGRTSVNAFNDMMNVLSRGIISGWACVPNSGMEVSLGGSGSVRDVAAAEDNAGNKTSINNISGSPISVTIPTAPASNSRIDSIVAYVDNPPTGSATATDNPGACGLIVVSGTAASSPVAPSESAIRTAITADGASGTTAYYVVLANITIASGTTDLTSDNIVAGAVAKFTGSGIVSSQNIDYTTLGGNYSTTEVDTGFTWVDGKHIYKKTVYIPSFPKSTENSYSHNISNISQILYVFGYMNAGGGTLWPLNMPPNPIGALTSGVQVFANSSNIVIRTGADRSMYDGYITIQYTKSS